MDSFSDAPIVTVQGMPTGDIEENIDSLSLRCVVTANPEAKIVWRKLDLSQIYSFDETLTFTPGRTLAPKLPNLVPLSHSSMFSLNRYKLVTGEQFRFSQYCFLTLQQKVR